jgi:non-specific serine/threonine protein kinase
MSDTMASLQVEPLSEREKTILRLLADGLTNREIADRLYLSYETVKWYNKQIYGKLGVSNRTQAGSRARERGLLNGDDLPPVGIASHPLRNLPAQVTSFVGRRQQLGEFADLIRDRSVRLVTLTGPGGVGKTRLALEVASGLSPEFSNQVFLVNLAPIGQPERVVDAIASALDLDVPTEISASDVLIDYLHGRHMLLLIDNFEQALEAAPLLVDLLSAAVDLKLLVTSREALGVYGETDYPVPPLSLPDLDQLVMVSDSLEYESIELFAQRARAAKPQFRLSESNLEPVSAICIRLDGLPLAIELAAARIKRLAPAELRIQLDRYVAALKIGPRGVPDRQRTLQATLTWSYELLEEAEKAVFVSLSVFRGPFILGAAEYIAGDHIPIGVEEVLESLINKNLLIQQGGFDEAYRFGMLETIHEYAQELLREGGEEEKYRGRHAEYFTQLAERATRELHGSEQIYWYGRLEAEYENIRSALAWTLGGGDREPGLRLVATLRDYWYYQGPSVDSLRWIELALENLDQTSPALRADVQLSAGISLLLDAQADRGNALLTDSLAIYRDLDDLRNAARALIFLGYSLFGQKAMYEEAISLCDEALILFGQEGDEAGIAQTLNIKGELARAQGDLDLAEESYRKALELFRKLGSRLQQIAVSFNLGTVAYSRGEFSEAEAIMRTGLALSWEIGFDHLIAYFLAALAGPISRRGNPAKAATLLGASASLRHVSGTMAEGNERPVLERYAVDVHDQMSEEAFESAHSKGSAMAVEDAVALALERSPKPSSPS